MKLVLSLSKQVKNRSFSVNFDVFMPIFKFPTPPFIRQIWSIPSDFALAFEAKIGKKDGEKMEKSWKMDRLDQATFLESYGEELTEKKRIHHLILCIENIK